MKKIFCISLYLAFGLAGAALAQDEAELLLEQQKYEQCIERAFSVPEMAYIDAVTWRNEGGGLPAAHCIAMSLVNQGDYRGAAEAFEALAFEMENGLGWSFAGEPHPNERGLLEEVYNQAGNTWLLAEDPIKAAEMFTLGLEGAEAGTQSHLNLLIDRARAYAGVENFEGALADLTAAEEMASQSAELHVLKASALRKLERYEEASEALATVFRLEPQNGEAYLERGILRFEVGNIPGARSDWQTYLELYPDGPGASYVRDNLAALETSGQTFDE